MSFSFISKIKNKFIKDRYEEAPSLSRLEKLTIERVEIAISNFKEADEDTIDLAIYELMAAEERLNLLIKERKKKQ